MNHDEQYQGYLSGLGTDQTIIDGTLEWFRLFASVPHGSWNEKELADLLTVRFTELGWVVERDQWNNMKVDVPGAPGLENLPPVIIQGHLDMVCAVAEGSGYVPERDPITVVVEDGILRSDRRSSLGADCGLGLSLGFYVVNSSLRRGPIRFILTAAEESGLEGAKLVDPAWLAGCKWMINVDAGSSNVGFVSCAGSRGERFRRKPETVPCKMTRAYTVKICGLIGGHSGAMIHMGRGNAIKLLGHFLWQLKNKLDFEMTDFRGGNAGNAIPADAQATIVVNEPEGLIAEVDRFQKQLSGYYKNIDPDVRLELHESSAPDLVWSSKMRDDTLNLLTLLHNGVFAMHDTISGQVNASANVGVCATDSQGIFQVNSSVRCHESFCEELIDAKCAAAAQATDFEFEVAVSYPGYDGNPNNPLAQLFDKVHQKQLGTPMQFKSVHAGLELGVLGAKNPELTVVCIGPDSKNAHSVFEQAPVDKFPVFSRLLAGVLEELAAEQ